MTIKAKTILKDKFWIIEDDNNRLGTLSWDDDRYLFSDNAGTCFFNNTKQMRDKFGSKVIFLNEEDNVRPISDYSVHNFPTSVQPYNAMYDVKRKLPLFTKSDKSKSMYCAGYYIIRFDKGWVKSFCPKLITLERYEYKGPFTSDIEMRSELSNASR